MVAEIKSFQFGQPRTIKEIKDAATERLLRQFDAKVNSAPQLDGEAIVIADTYFEPAVVLKTLEPDVYDEKFSEYVAEIFSEVKMIVMAEFPTPVAYPFDRAERGVDSELERLLHLRDTWEALIRLFHALVISELRSRRVNLGKDGVGLTTKTIFSNSIARILENIIASLIYANENGLSLVCESLIPGDPLDTIQRIKNLHELRNELSHSQAPDEARAIELVQEVEGDLLPVLLDFEGLRGLQLLRYRSQTHLEIRADCFQGANLMESRLKFVLSGESFIKYMNILQPSHLLARVDDEIFCLEPFAHFREIEGGARLELCLLKGMVGNKRLHSLSFEPVGRAPEYEVESALYADEINDIEYLLQ